MITSWVDLIATLFDEATTIWDLKSQGLIFKKIWYSTTPEGRQGISETKAEAKAYGGPTARISRAWKCFRKDTPLLVSFGAKRIDAAKGYQRLQEAIHDSATRKSRLE